MSKYWREHFNANAERYGESLLKQVGKTVHGREVGQPQIELIVAAIRKNLDLSAKDSVLDLCCGNGLVTGRIAEVCRNVLGIDYADKLIGEARKWNSKQNTEYRIADVTAVGPELFRCYRKAYMYEGLQHLGAGGLSRLMGAMFSAQRSGLFFVGGVPDKSRLESFYDTEEKLAFYRDREAAGKPHMGRWWDRSELVAIGEHCGLDIHCFSQDPSLYTAYYRFDCLFSRE